eukprot:5442796-Pyramimonas_sp.AAC.1
MHRSFACARLLPGVQVTEAFLGSPPLLSARAFAPAAFPRSFASSSRWAARPRWPSVLPQRS